MITFSDKKIYNQNDLIELYESVGWTNYTKDSQVLANAIKHSLYVYTAWDNGTLIGLIRCIGDGTTILYIQDILVRPDYQHIQVGSTLMKHTLDHFPDIRQKVLLTEETPKTRKFYEKFGFSSCDQGTLVAFYRSF